MPVTIQRTEQVGAVRSGEVPSTEQIAGPTRIVSAVAATQSAGWQKLTRTAASTTTGLVAPAASGATLRTTTRRAELINREREALTDIHNAMLASVDDTMKELLRPIFAAELEAVGA